MDNASDDDTVDFLDRLARALPLRYQRNDENVGLIRGAQPGRAARHRATGSASCTTTPRCATRAGSSACRARWRPRRAIGLAGLYGVARLRRDGRYVGRTIVHCLEERADAPRARRGGGGGGRRLPLPRRATSWTRSAASTRATASSTATTAISPSRCATGPRCAVVKPLRAPGRGHAHGRGRAGPRREDLAQRRAALARFARKWGHGLPATCGACASAWPTACARFWPGRRWSVVDALGKSDT